MSNKEKVSQYFIDAVTGIGGGTCCQVLCEWCGRTHFVDDYTSGDYYEGELEELRENAKKEPDKFIIHCDGCSIGFANFCGKTLVWGCKCNQSDELQKYEQWVWAHRYQILKYLKSRINGEYENKKIEKEIADEFLKTI